ncbi:ATP-binding protein [Halobaculum marinum]|uniref:ATP-binding protein n=1 Tax=Halobaculum marinum TaxID=3031996 RepID=A0ABD5WWA4_9EURY|nr:ATPase [Halobaculum sp. DT55]
MHVIGRDGDGPDTPEGCGQAYRAPLGRFRAGDGSAGARVAVDLDRPHAALIVGKRGSGKTHTLAVVAEGVAATPGVAPVVIDPMGVLGGLAECGGSVHRRPRVRPDAVAAAAWPALLDLDPAGPVGSLVWRAVAERDGATLAAARDAVADADAERATRRAADAHLALAQRWDVFDPAGLTPADLTGGDVTVLDCSGLSPTALDAVSAAVARSLYEARVAEDVSRLPWLFVDEAHAVFDGVAGGALETLLTRGRAPGVSLVCATQRPAALPAVAVSQADLLLAHRLRGRADVEALRDARPKPLADDLRSRLPTGVGEALVVDDATETATTVAVRERWTTDGGASARASRVDATADGDGRETSEGVNPAGTQSRPWT